MSSQKREQESTKSVHGVFQTQPVVFPLNFCVFFYYNEFSDVYAYKYMLSVSILTKHLLCRWSLDMLSHNYEVMDSINHRHNISIMKMCIFLIN